MNEWMLAFALSLGMNAMFWILLHNRRTDMVELLRENERLWRSNVNFNLIVTKLRAELKRERANATIHGDRVSED